MGGVGLQKALTNKTAFTHLRTKHRATHTHKHTDRKPWMHLDLSDSLSYYSGLHAEQRCLRLSSEQMQHSITHSITMEAK